ncbi:hypothetical protein GW17_00039133 [Ensete ventricosum]|nr:hypothetical protein GW17_00039133 [Ensete ventricosum]
MGGGLLSQLLGFFFWGFLWLAGPVSVYSGGPGTSGADAVAVVVDGTAAIAVTDGDFVCATLDWWPPDKCDYGTCSWGLASLLNLVSSVLFRWWLVLMWLAIMFSFSCRLSISITKSGACADSFGRDDGTNWSLRALFDGGDRIDEAIPRGFERMESHEIYASAVIIFGLNALNGRVPLRDGSLGGPWNYTNAAALIRYTVDKGYTIHGWELVSRLVTLLAARDYATVDQSQRHQQQHHSSFRHHSNCVLGSSEAASRGSQNKVQPHSKAGEDERVHQGRVPPDSRGRGHP